MSDQQPIEPNQKRNATIIALFVAGWIIASIGWSVMEEQRRMASSADGNPPRIDPKVERIPSSPAELNAASGGTVRIEQSGAWTISPATTSTSHVVMANAADCEEIRPQVDVCVIPRHGIVCAIYYGSGGISCVPTQQPVGKEGK